MDLSTGGWSQKWESQREWIKLKLTRLFHSINHYKTMGFLIAFAITIWLLWKLRFPYFLLSHCRYFDKITSEIVECSCTKHTKPFNLVSYH